MSRVFDQEADKSSKEYRKNWARLIQKTYEVDPLTCPKYRGVMRIRTFIEDREVIRAILKHLGLWLVKLPPAPQAHAPSALNHEDLKRFRFCCSAKKGQGKATELQPEAEVLNINGHAQIPLVRLDMGDWCSEEATDTRIQKNSGNG